MRMLTVLLVLTTGAACATTGPVHAEHEPQVGDRCPHPRYILISCGSSFREVSGRLVAHDPAGAQRPIRSPRVQLASLRDVSGAGKTKLQVTSDGSFTAVLGLPWSEHLNCKDGVLAASEIVLHEEYAFWARGCEPTVVSVGPDWVPRDIELRCDK